MANIKIKNITVKYKEKTVLDNFSLQVNDGEILGIVGPSGCGKTTILRALCGFIKPEAGEIYKGDQCLFSKTKRTNIPPEKRNIGVVFQDYAVWPHMSVWKNILYPLKKHKIPKLEAERRAKIAISQVRLNGYENHMPSQLSGGQQQRVAIARALVSSQDIVVLDEPITNLDAKLREEMILEIKNIQKEIGTTIIYITHDQEAVLELCDRICIMNPKGEIAQIGTDSEIIHHPKSKYVFSFIGVSNFIPINIKNDKSFFDVGYEIEYMDKFEHKNFGKYEMGIRPMNIIFDKNSSIKATIEMQAFLGNQYNYFLKFGNMQLRVERNTIDVLNDNIQYNIGDTVGIKFLNPIFYKVE